MVTIPCFGHSQSYFDTRSLEVNANQMNYRNSIYYLLLIGFFLPSLSLASIDPPRNIIASINQYSYANWVYWDPVPEAKAYSVSVQVSNQLPERNDFYTAPMITTGNFYRYSGLSPTADMKFVVYSCEDTACEKKSKNWVSVVGKSTVDKRVQIASPFSYSYAEEIGYLQIAVKEDVLKDFQEITKSEMSDIRLSIIEHCQVDCYYRHSRIDPGGRYSIGWSKNYSERQKLKSNDESFKLEIRLCTAVEISPILKPFFDESSAWGWKLKADGRLGEELICADGSQSFEILRYSDSTWESKINAIDNVESSTDQNNSENESLSNNSDEDQSDTIGENVTTDAPIEVNDGESVSQINDIALGTLNWGGDFGSSNWHEIPKTGIYHELIDSALKFKASNVKKYSGSSSISATAAMNFFRGSNEEWVNSWGPDIIFGSLNSNTKEVKTNFRRSELIEVYASIKSGNERIGVNGGNFMIFVKASIGSEILYGFNGIINGWEIWNFGKNFPWRASRAGGEWSSLIGQLASDERVSVLQGVALPVGTYEFHVLLRSCKDTCSSHMNIDPFVVTVSQ